MPWHPRIDPSPIPLVNTGPATSADVGTSRSTAAQPVPLPTLATPSIARVRTWLLCLTLAAAIVFRFTGLDSFGFSDDEMNKVQAVESYRAWKFDANAEHPMLMKLLMLASTEAAEGWNHVAAGVSVAGAALPHIAPETALRAPNALAGALTTLLLFLLVELLFDTRVALAASMFWALDVNATAINRIGKEDSLLLLFLLLGAWLYERGKQVGRWDPVRAQRWYASSGGAFGLMLASKYMPHYFGLYALFNTVSDRTPGANKPVKRWFYLALAAAFFIGNAAVLLPSVWDYIRGYTAGETLAHHGYLFAHKLWVNGVSNSPWGLPVTFYAAFFLTKVPLTVLTVIALGLGELWRRSSERGMIFLRIFLVFVLLPYSLISSKFLRYMLPALAMLDIVAALGLVWLLQRIERSRMTELSRFAGVMAALAIAVAGPLAAQLSSAPYPSVYQNAFGREVSAGLLFPDDELYDYGVREAVARIAQDASPGAVIASEVPTVVRWYLDAAGRRDVATTRLSADGLPAFARRDGSHMVPVHDGWALTQDAHLYFENEPLISLLRTSYTPWTTVKLHEHTAVEAYRVTSASTGTPAITYHYVPAIVDPLPFDLAPASAPAPQSSANASIGEIRAAR